MSVGLEAAVPPCLVREARDGDLAGVAGLRLAGDGAAWTAGMIAADPARTVVVATVGGELVGVAKTHHHPEARAEAPAGHYLGGILVSQRWRRRGIGTMLTTARLDWIWERRIAPRTRVHGRGGPIGSGSDDFRLLRNPHRPIPATERNRHGVSPRPVSRISHLHMHVGLGAVTGVPAFSDQVAGLHPLSRVYPDRALPQMRKQDEGAVGCCGDHHVIAGHSPDALADPVCLAQHVRHERELRTAPLMIWLAVKNSCHSPGQGSEDGLSEPDERFGAFRRDEGAPRSGRGPAGSIDGHEIDRVGSPESVCTMARHTACRTVLHPPASPEGQVEHD